jgi:hypothetical protein
MDGTHFGVRVRGQEAKELMFPFDRIGFRATPSVP